MTERGIGRTLHYGCIRLVDLHSLVLSDRLTGDIGRPDHGSSDIIITYMLLPDVLT